MLNCCASPAWPPGLTPLPFNLHSTVNEEIVSKVIRTVDLYQALPDEYRARKLLRIAAIGAFALMLTVSLLALGGGLLTFPQAFLHFVQTVSWIKVAAGALIVLVLSGGAAIVIHKVRGATYRVTESSPKALWGDRHWVSAVYTREDQPNECYSGYIDTSTLDGIGMERAFMYAYKPMNEHYNVSLAVLVCTPIHMAGAIGYNIARIVVIPFYILGAMLMERLRGQPLFPEGFFAFSDISKQVSGSLWRIVKAPFCATGIMFAALFSFIDPLNGRKLGAYIELYWNEGVTRAEGFWSVRGCQSLWKPEGGGSPSNLGKNGFYLAGCWQPVAVVYYQDGKIIGGSSLSKALVPEAGKVYKIHTRATLTHKYERLRQSL